MTPTRLRNIALTVHELEPGEFYWVLLEGSDARADLDEAEDAMPYRPLEAAIDPQVTYANALVAGVAAIRRIYGPGGPRS